MKYLKPPYLSTPLSKSGKRLKRRLSNILSPSLRRGGAFLLAAVMLLCVFIGCESESVGIIGGADGPTSVFVTASPASELYELKTPYIGNASAAGSVAKALIDYERGEWKGMKLQTDSEPYALILTYVLKEKEHAAVPADPFDMNAPLFFALIDNLGTLTVNVAGFYDSASKTYTREELDTAYNKPIAEYARTEEGFAELYALCLSQKNLDEAVSNAILTSNAGRFYEGEFRAEGHIILSSSVLDNGNTEYYVLARYSEFGFENGVFTAVSGSGNIPVRITFDDDLNLLEYKIPMDGSYYIESVKEMFPEEFISRAINQTDEDIKYCYDIITKKAKAYLKTIGRDAEVLEYGDFPHVLLTDIGVSVEVSNMMSENKSLSEYPYWIGNLERVEDGTRYVYSLDYNPPFIIYKKTEYDTGKTVESFTFNTETGEAAASRKIS